MGCAASKDTNEDFHQTVVTPGVGSPSAQQAQLNLEYTREVTLAELSTITSSCSAYFELDGLLASVESGAIAPIKGRWLVRLHEQGGRLKRRQDMPAEAFWSPGELRRVATQLGDNFGVLFVALSYRWLAREHPDPNGFHLAIVAAASKLYLGLAGKQASSSPLVAALHSLGMDTDFALFWDFSSLFQSPRSEAETVLFERGLEVSNVWYGHSRSVCWMQSELPEGFDGVAYDKSGWCFVEAAISAAVKVGFNRLDLSKRTTRAMEWCYGASSWANEARLDCVCTGRRLPPPTPEQVRHRLETEMTFTNQADVAAVSDLYSTFFSTVMACLEHLDVHNLSWGADEVETLCGVVPRFSKLTLIE